MEDSKSCRDSVAVPAKCPKISFREPSLSLNCSSATTSKASLASNFCSNLAASLSSLALSDLASERYLACWFFSFLKRDSLSLWALVSANCPLRTTSRSSCGFEGTIVSSSTSSDLTDMEKLKAIKRANRPESRFDFILFISLPPRFELAAQVDQLLLVY